MLPPYMGWPNLVQVNADAAAVTWPKFIHPEGGNNIFLRTVRTDNFFTWFKSSETHHLNNLVHFLLTSMHLFQWLHHYLKWMQKSCSLNASIFNCPWMLIINPPPCIFTSSFSVVEVCSGDRHISCFHDLSTVHGMWCHIRCSKESKVF